MELLEERQKKPRTRRLRFSFPCKDHKRVCDKWQEKRIPLDKSASEQGWQEGRAGRVCRGLTSQCTHRCCSRSWCPQSLVGTCRCSCWRSGCRCPRSCMAHSDTRWCLSDICPHGTQAGRCTRRSLSHPRTRLRSGRDLGQKHHSQVLKWVIVKGQAWRSCFYWEKKGVTQPRVWQGTDKLVFMEQVTAKHYQ